MKVTGIIAEYNPFHNGHAYQIQEARKITGADYIVVVMSGDFTQRGIPAIIDKYSRTEMALKAGADLVIELPLYYASGSAEFFANGAISILDKLGVIDSLLFGSECGDIELLTDIADILIDKKEILDHGIKEKVKTGISYPQARIRTIEEIVPNAFEHVDAMSQPNNILGFEYIRALKNRNSAILPYTNKRNGSGYHDRMVMNILSSALAIRSSIEANDSLEMVKDQMPDYVYDILQRNFKKTFPVYNEDISALLKYKLLLDAPGGYYNYADISPDFSDKIEKNLSKYISYNQYCDLLKTKDITYARVGRCLLHILLNIRKDNLHTYVDNDFTFYARMLGFRKNSGELLSKIKKNSSIPLISKLADAKNILSPLALEMLDADIQSAHIYDTVVTEKYKQSNINEFQREIIVID